jgi:hypothetical protein
LSEFIAQVLEHLLPWLLSTLVSWVNEGLEEDDQLCPELPAYVRFGVDTPVALELARAGVRSRPRRGRCGSSSTTRPSGPPGWARTSHRVVED